MKKIDLGQAIGILANIGVIAGIVFLAIEVSQNQASLEEANRINLISAREASFSSVNDFNLLLATNEDLARVFQEGLSGDTLTPLDEFRFGALCNATFWRQAVSYERSQALGNTQSAQATIRLLAGQIANSPGLESCWDEQKSQFADFGLGAFAAGVDASR